MRLPPTDCCPTHAIICEMFRGDPFDPHSAMIRGLHGHTSHKTYVQAKEALCVNRGSVRCVSIAKIVLPNFVDRSKHRREYNTNTKYHLKLLRSSFPQLLVVGI